MEKQRIYPYEYMSDFEKFKEELPSKDIKITKKEYHNVSNIWNKLEMKTTKDYHDLYLKCDVFYY